MANARLVERIRAIHAESDATYGMPRVRAELIEQGPAVSRKRVPRQMRQHGIRGVSRRRGFVLTIETQSFTILPHREAMRSKRPPAICCSRHGSFGSRVLRIAATASDQPEDQDRWAEIDRRRRTLFIVERVGGKGGVAW